MSTSQRPMTFSYRMYPYDRWGGVESMVEVAKVADELGYHSAMMVEHMAMPKKLKESPISDMWYDPLVLAGYLLANTKRLRVFFNVLVIPYHNPFRLAKGLATLDVISKGRVDCGVGAGWMEGEFKQLGVPFEERGAITDEYLRAMKELWTSESPTFKGKYVSFSNLSFLPKCVQKPHIPLWIGGSGPRPMRRVVELGDGWSPMKGTMEELRQVIASVKEKAKAAGRDPSKLGFACSLAVGGLDEASRRARAHAGGSQPPEVGFSAKETVEAVREFQAIGVNHLGINVAWEKPSEHAEKLRWFAREVMGKV